MKSVFTLANGFYAADAVALGVQGPEFLLWPGAAGLRLKTRAHSAILGYMVPCKTPGFSALLSRVCALARAEGEPVFHHNTGFSLSAK